MFFENPNPGACHMCGKTEDLTDDGITPLVGDEPWMICSSCEAERAAADKKAAEEKAEMENKINFIESMPSHRD